MNNKLQEILKKNAEFEKESPYNFCDRWCERCDFKIQRRCKLYLDELDRRATNIAHGKPENDLEILKQDFEDQMEEMEDSIDEWAEEEGVDPFELEPDEGFVEEIRKKEEELHKHPLQKVTYQYMKISHDFLKEEYYSKQILTQDMRLNYEIVAWYHSLLPAKMHRALCGLYVPDVHDEEDYALCDAVAQFAVCRKSISLSVASLREIGQQNSQLKKRITLPLTLLHNMASQIDIILKEIG